MSTCGVGHVGSSLSVLSFVHFGPSTATRSLACFASSLSTFFPGGYLGFIPRSPFSARAFAWTGASSTLMSTARSGTSMSASDLLGLDSPLLVQSLSRSSFASVVFSASCLGSSLSSRGAAHAGSPASLSGLVRLSSPMFVRDSVCIAPSAQLQLPVWTISWDTGTSELQFKTGSTKVMAVSASGGSLHGTWASESIISASDSHLKREVLPLYRSLLEKGEQNRAGGGAGNEERDDISASSLLRLLVPDGSSDPLNFKLEATDESLRSLPGVVREMPNQGGRLGISHQDLLAVITLAAKERERRLQALEAEEEAEIAQQEEQNGLIQALFSQVEQLTKRFTLLRYQSSRRLTRFRSM
ncbi:Lsm7 [Symbiodinium sp. CCMP2456]|nr:Lsm7 [Symbiodinium sp. CCMP2456]